MFDDSIEKEQKTLKQAKNKPKKTPKRKRQAKK